MTSRPILFTGPMVQAILDGRKTQTRRLVKPQPKHRPIFCEPGKTTGLTVEECFEQGAWYDADCVNPGIKMKCPYAPGDQLWVKETWRVNDRDWDDDWLRIGYRASPEPETKDSEEYTKVWSKRIPIPHEKWPDQFNRVTDRSANKWRPSIYMPRWASRITLEIVSVRVERVQDITNDDVWAEGAGQLPGMSAQETYAILWESICGKDSWKLNPWVWKITFKKL